MKARIAGAEIEYDVRGKGPVVLLFHAFPLGHFMWDAQVDALAPTHQVIRFDARGFASTFDFASSITTARKSPVIARSWRDSVVLLI